MSNTVLIHLASGVGNIVFSTPLILAVSEMGWIVDLRVDADYPATIDLFAGWSAVRSARGRAFPLPLESYSRVIPAIPPFYWGRFARLYRYCGNALPRPPDSLFARDEQAYYFEFARQLGYPSGQRPFPYVPVSPSPDYGVTAATVVLAPGCKTGEMAAKRWPHFAELAAHLPDLALAGTRDDITGLEFPPHARNFIDRLSLAEAAAMMASAGLVVANDSGLAHLAAASGVPTLMLFGPTSEQVLGAFPPHVTVLRVGLSCEPCWNAARLQHCCGMVTCLRSLTVDRVLDEIRRILVMDAARSEPCAGGKMPYPFG